MTEFVRQDTVLDTAALQLGRIYAQALIDSAEKEQCTDQVIGQLGEVVDDVLAEHPQLRAVFASPRIESEEKCRVIDQLFGDMVHPILLRFFKVTSRRGRLGFLREIHRSAEEIRNEMLGKLVAEVRTAQALTDELRSRVQDQISRSLGKSIVLREVVDPSLIGGLVVRYGDTVIDNSVASKLERVTRSATEGLARRLVLGSGEFASET